MKSILGNFMEQPNRDFPLDCEAATNLQNNTSFNAILGNVAGDKTIIKGCGLNQAGTERVAGYVFLCTKAFPDGELLFWEGGSVERGMYLKEVTTSVFSKGYNYVQAYTSRSLAPGLGTENYSWSDFKDIATIKQLQEQNTSLQNQINLIVPPPIGIVQMWAGHSGIGSLPDNYALCDGSNYLGSAYPELYAVIGRTHTPSSVPAGYFCLPDLRGRFIAGYNLDDEDYNAVGEKGGEKKVALSESEIPEHGHKFKNYYYIENGNGGIDGNDPVGRNVGGSKSTDYDNRSLWYVNSETKTVGEGRSHENRPPYYTLAYIMRIK